MILTTIPYINQDQMDKYLNSIWFLIQERILQDPSSLSLSSFDLLNQLLYTLGEQLQEYEWKCELKDFLKNLIKLFSLLLDGQGTRDDIRSLLCAFDYIIIHSSTLYGWKIVKECIEYPMIMDCLYLWTIKDMQTHYTEIIDVYLASQIQSGSVLSCFLSFAQPNIKIHYSFSPLDHSIPFKSLLDKMDQKKLPSLIVAPIYQVTLKLLASKMVKMHLHYHTLWIRTRSLLLQECTLKTKHVSIVISMLLSCMLRVVELTTRPGMFTK